jgi:hypothetical protein
MACERAVERKDDQFLNSRCQKHLYIYRQWIYKESYIVNV